MPVRIAVVDPLPMFVRGLAATLAEMGHRAETPDDVLTWLRRPGEVMVLLTVAREPDWRLATDVVQVRPDGRLIVVLPRADLDGWMRAVAAGAVGALPRDATPTAVSETVRAALSSQSLLPVDVLRSVMAGQQPGAAGQRSVVRVLSDGEIEWLRELAGGSTVARLAERVGYSERMMFRLLAKVYERLGVRNRTMAIMRARDEGWL